MNISIILIAMLLTSISEVQHKKNNEYADVLSVIVTGSEGNYTLKVKIKSPDKGCDQYADWWEVIDSQGKLLYRRILRHSHVGEQPFERSGGPVRISARREIFIRAHMNNQGYGGAAFGGTVQRGLNSIYLKQGFARDVATIPPLPGDCAF